MTRPTFAQRPDQPWLFYPMPCWPWLVWGALLVAAATRPRWGWLTLGCGLLAVGGLAWCLVAWHAARALKVCPWCFAHLPRPAPRCAQCGFDEGVSWEPEP